MLCVTIRFVLVDLKATKNKYLQHVFLRNQRSQDKQSQQSYAKEEASLFSLYVQISFSSLSSLSAMSSISSLSSLSLNYVCHPLNICVYIYIYISILLPPGNMVTNAHNHCDVQRPTLNLCWGHSLRVPSCFEQTNPLLYGQRASS